MFTGHNLETIINKKLNLILKFIYRSTNQNLKYKKFLTCSLLYTSN